jgi:hypothetical protein
MEPQVGEIWFVCSTIYSVYNQYYLITERQDTPKGMILCNMIRLSDGDNIVGYLWDDRVNWVKHF